MENGELGFKKGLKDGLPIGLGYLSVSFAFGVQASLLLIPVLVSLFISLTNLTSAGQLAGITVIAALGSFSEIILTQLVINSRYFLMGISLSQKTDESLPLKKRLFYGAFITDEIYAVLSTKEKINSKYFLGLIVLPYFGWAIGTLVGAIMGSVLPGSIIGALGISLYAMFIAIIIPPSFKDKGVFMAVLLGAAISCVFYYLPALSFISQGFAIIISALFSAFVVAALFPVKKED